MAINISADARTVSTQIAVIEVRARLYVLPRRYSVYLLIGFLASVPYPSHRPFGTLRKHTVYDGYTTLCIVGRSRGLPSLFGIGLLCTNGHGVLRVSANMVISFYNLN